MSELQAILAAYAAIDEPAFLATVVQISGSTYRRAGARSLITASGQIIGMISGGCLEADIFEQTQQQIINGKPILVTTIPLLRISYGALDWAVMELYKY